MEQIINSSPIIVFLWKAEKGWPVEYVTDNIQQFGYMPSDFTSGRIPYANMIHPDDLEFGCTGTFSKFLDEGYEIIYIIATNGENGFKAHPKLNPNERIKIREKEQLEAAQLLGVKEVVFLRHSDQSLEDTPEFRKEIVRLIRTYKPEIVITSDPYRRYIWHRDHRIVGRVTLDAVFPYSRDVWAYPELLDEGLEPHKVKEVWLWASDDVNFRSDISETFDLKLKALQCHKSQIKEPFASEMEKWLCERAKDMAEGEKFKLAEGFHRAEIWW